VLRFEPGEYTLVFELLPAARLRGRILADATEEFLCVSLVDREGRPLPVASSSGFTHPAPWADTSASGHFELSSLPIGSYRLRSGTRAELQQGLFRSELPLELHAGANGPVELR